MPIKPFVPLLVSFVAASSASFPAMAEDRPSADRLLQSGETARAETAFAEYLKDHPDDAQARFELGVVQVIRSVERLAQSLHGYGLQGARSAPPFLRLPVPPNPEPEPVTYAKLRKVYERLLEDLSRAQETLEQVGDAEVRLPLHFGLIRLDLNGDGKADADETLWKIYARITRQERRITDEQAEEFVIAFDRGDVYWLRGYCHLLMGLDEFILAHDWQKAFERTAQLFFANPETPHKFLQETPQGQRGLASPWIADAIALIHLIDFPVEEPQRMKSALGHLQAMIEMSRKSWKAIEAERDDDHEWIPNPRQTGVIPGVRVTEEMVAAWREFLDEAEAILQGKKLVPHWRIADGRGVNLRRIFTEPRRFDLVLWVQGSAAGPYLEKGPLTQPDFWGRLRRTFRGQFVGFAVWFN